jgi:SHAQKYF class myb-like DNA-binding protein
MLLARDNIFSENENNNSQISNSEGSNDGDVKNGRWTEEEHVKFIEAIFIYGNEWKKVQNYLKTRTSSQARSHAQKFFLKLRKDLNLDSYYPGEKLPNDINDEKNKELVTLIFDHLKGLLFEKSENAEQCLLADKTGKLVRMLFNFCKNRERIQPLKSCDNKAVDKRRDNKVTLRQPMKKSKLGVLFKVERDDAR